MFVGKEKKKKDEKKKILRDVYNDRSKAFSYIIENTFTLNLLVQCAVNNVASIIITVGHLKSQVHKKWRKGMKKKTRSLSHHPTLHVVTGLKETRGKNGNGNGIEESSSCHVDQSSLKNVTRSKKDWDPRSLPTRSYLEDSSSNSSSASDAT